MIFWKTVAQICYIFFGVVRKLLGTFSKLQFILAEAKVLKKATESWFRFFFSSPGCAVLLAQVDDRPSAGTHMNFRRGWWYVGTATFKGSMLDW